MLSLEDPRLLPLVQDYKVHLIEPAALKLEDLGKFRSSLREVLGFIKYSRDQARLGELLQADDRFRSLDWDAALVIQACTNMKLEKKEETEECDMCKAIEDMMKDSLKEGMEKGRKEGMEKGRKEGMEEERANTERERMRADLAEKEVERLREELERYKRGA